MSKKETVAKRDGESAHAVKIMNDIHAIYAKGEDALSTLARGVGLTVHPPRRKVNVLIIGNHSAGKSSFVNWYIEDHVQRTGVAIETQGFTIVTSGKQKTLAPIKGDSTIMLYPHLEPLKEKFGKPLVENLTTCVSTSTMRHFPMVDFIDSPGLVDGDISYPFNVNEAIVEFADHVDLIFVFMDPMGQALCSRTMQVVKELNKKHFDKMKYYLTKADTVNNPKELMKLMVQITQNIKEHINNQHGLEIPAIWLPDGSEASRNYKDPALNGEVNQITDVCASIEKAIHQKVQDNLSQVETDCHVILEKTQELLAKNELEIAAKKSRELVAVFFSVCAWTIPLVTFLTLVGEFEHLLPEVIVDAEVVMTFVRSLYAGVRPLLFDADEKLGVVAFTKFLSVSMVLFLVLHAISKFTYSRAKKFTPQKKEVITQWRNNEQIIRGVAQRRQELFLDYVRAYTRVDDLQ